jgi:hypothetical protein
MRVGAWNELAGQHEALLREIEVKNAVARRRVIRRFEPVQARELAADRRLPVVVAPAREDEVIVGDRRLPRKDRVSARNLVERVDGEGRRAVRGREQVRVHAQGGAGPDIGRLVDAMRPDDLLG